MEVKPLRCFQLWHHDWLSGIIPPSQEQCRREGGGGGGGGGGVRGYTTPGPAAHGKKIRSGEFIVF